jgi:hypothetical protein
MAWNPATGFWNDIWSYLSGSLVDLAFQSEIGLALLSFATTLFGQLISILYLVLYPFILLIVIIQNILIAILTPFIMLINSIYLVGNTFYTVLMVFSTVFPAPWMVLLTALISINMGIAIYHYVKGISIFGFKIG